MKKTLAGVLLGAAIGAALSADAAALASPALASPAMTSTALTSSAATGSLSHPVVLVGIPGLRWDDVSAAATPVLWRLAAQGSVGTLVVHTIMPRTCPADGWLTLNAAARASVPHRGSAPCPQPDVVIRQQAAGSAPGTPVAADVPSMPSLIRYNRQFHYSPDWGILRSAAGRGQCATAVGPGAALALAGAAGNVSGYLPSASAASRSTFARCPLTAVSLGAIPAPPGAGGNAMRAAAVRADDRALGRIIGELPEGATTVVFAPGDDTAPHLRLIVVDGPGYSAGLLDSASTRQPGITQLTDITPTVLHWRGQPVPSSAVGSQLQRADRGSLAAEIRTLLGQDTSAQVYRATFGWFFAIFVITEVVFFGLLAVLLRGRQEERRRRRWAVARVAGVVAGSVPAGSFLASLVPWWLLPHPAVLLYSLAAAWAVVIAAIALAGPWRRDPLGPPGAVAALTLAIIALDVMTGSRLELGTPFGLSVLLGGRFYGADNNTIGIYGAAGILCSAWLAAMVLRSAGRRSGARRPADTRLSADASRSDGASLSADASRSPGMSWRTAANGWAASGGWGGPRGRAVLVVSAVALFAVIASGWPGFGAKVGGTIAMVPGFILLIMAVANVRLSARRAVIVALSGLALFAVFALVNYFVPVTGHSDIGAFAGQTLHGGAGGTLHRKISTNIGSLSTTPYNFLIPLIVVGLGLLLLWPDRVTGGALPRAWQTVPLLKVSFVTIWIMAVLGWFAEDSGVGVPGSTLPFVLPLSISIVASAALSGDQAPPENHDQGRWSPGVFSDPSAGSRARVLGLRRRVRGDHVARPAAAQAGQVADNGGDAERSGRRERDQRRQLVAPAEFERVRGQQQDDGGGEEQQARC
jgi:hypothetical protein